MAVKRPQITVSAQYGQSGTPLVSIVMPVYNAANVLGTTLDSLRAQTLQNFELICVDDGSTDESAEVVAQYAKEDRRITLIRKDNGGAATARNLGLEHASGKYIAFLDSDDIYLPTMIQSMTESLESNGADICVCETDTFVDVLNDRKPYFRFPKGLTGGTYRREELDPRLFRCFNSVAPYNKMLARRFVEEHMLRFQNLPNCNDAFFIVSAIVLSDAIAVLPKPLVCYRQGRGTSLQDGKVKYPLCSLEVAEKLLLTEQLDRHLTSAGKASLAGEIWSLAHHAVEMSMHAGRCQREAYARAMAAANQCNLSHVHPRYFKSMKEYYKYITYRKSSISGLIWAYSMKRSVRGKKPINTQVRLATRLMASALLPI